jgi:inner membrane protease subunit 1
LVKAKVLAVILPFEDAKWLGSERDVMDPQEGEREWVMK